MSFLLDVNLLIALLWENHEHHRVARTWLRRVTGFVTSPVSQLGFARVSSHPLLGYSMSPDEAFGVLRRFLADSRHRFIPDDLSCVDRVLRTDLMGNANQVTDHYLVALARQHELTLATFDEPLARAFATEGRFGVVGAVSWIQVLFRSLLVRGPFCASALNVAAFRYTLNFCAITGLHLPFSAELQTGVPQPSNLRPYCLSGNGQVTADAVADLDATASLTEG